MSGEKAFLPGLEPQRQKPTKVTKDDLELADELSRITTIKGLLESFSSAMTELLAGLSDVSFRGNPVQTHAAIQDTWSVMEGSLQSLQTDLLRELAQVNEEDAQAIAAAQPDDDGTVPEEIPGTIDETLLGHYDDDDGASGVGEPK